MGGKNERHRTKASCSCSSPCPAEGHVNVMLKLAELLTLSDIESRFLSCYGELIQLKAISDGYPPDQPRSNITELMPSFNASVRPLLKKMLDSDDLCSESLKKPRVNCIIGNGIIGNLTSDIEDELEIPVLHFWTVGGSCFWAYFRIRRLFETDDFQ